MTKTHRAHSITNSSTSHPQKILIQHVSGKHVGHMHGENARITKRGSSGETSRQAKWRSSKAHPPRRSRHKCRKLSLENWTRNYCQRDVRKWSCRHGLTKLHNYMTWCPHETTMNSHRIANNNRNNKTMKKETIKMQSSNAISTCNRGNLKPTNPARRANTGALIARQSEVKSCRSAPPWQWHDSQTHSRHVHHNHSGNTPMPTHMIRKWNKCILLHNAQGKLKIEKLVECELPT